MKDNISAFHEPKTPEDSAFFTFQPRPNRPELFDEQEAFIENQDLGVAFHVGGNGCLGGEQEIYDPVQNRYCRIDSIGEPFHVISRDCHGNERLSRSSRPFVKGVSELYRYSLSNGLSFVATSRHVVLCEDATWRPMSALSVGDALLVGRQHRDRKSVDIHDSSTDPTMCGETFRLSRQSVVGSVDHLDSICGSYEFVHSTTRHASLLSRRSLASSDEIFLSLFLKCGHHSSRRQSDLSDHCWKGLHLHGEPLQSLLSIVQDTFLPLGDVLARNQPPWHVDDQGNARECIHPYQQFDRHSKSHYDCQERRDLASQIHYAQRLYSRSFDGDDTRDRVLASNTPGSHRTTSDRQSPASSFLPFRTNASCRQSATESSFPLQSPLDKGGNRFNTVYITAIEFIRKDRFYDIHVPGDNNYLCAGIWHHNSGTSTAAACKIARLLLSRQEAPRYDCPFWIVGVDYEQTIESMWKEKLYGMGFIPDCEVNWERITWHDKRRELPATIPLKPWVNGDKRKNWVLEFRSFAQGRMAMQARALGGFCLTEQFPWEILVEILRGMRQHNIPGSKFCEFTPIDPSLSAPLKEMMENNTLPKGWAVYRANTLCNVLDPNSPVDKEWYDEFFGMVGDELLETRRTGAWASYEGLIYKSLNSRVHFVDNAPIPRNCVHKRGVDWGGGPYNAFCVLWGAKDDKGHWCYMPDMEVLTKRGWIKFEDLKTGEQVGTTNLQGRTATMEWQVPFEYQKILYDGDVIETQKQIGGVSFGVTANHDMVLQKNFNNKGFVKRKASQLLNDGGCNYNIPITWNNCLQDDDNDTFVVGNVTTTKLNFCRFIGLWIAEGYLMKNQSSIAITQKTMIHEVEEILSKCGGKLWRKYTKKNGMTEWHLTSKELCQWVKSNGMYKYSREKTIARCLMGWGTSIRGILQGLEVGDGIHHKRKNKVTERAIFTTSIQLANDIQELCALIGTPTKVTPLQYDKESFNNTRRQVPLPPVMQTVYRVNLRRSYSATPRALSLTSRKYSGYVYCVSVPNGNLIVRKEHGTPFICGNCIYDELYTTESITWEERLRLLHEKDGWSLVMDHPGPPASYRLEPHPEVPIRWRYDMSTFGPTYAPPDDPGAFRECRHYCFPVVQGKTGLSNSYHPSIECIQAMLRYTPEEFKSGTAPLLKIDRARCPNLAREMQILRWQVPPSHATNPRAPKPLQIKDQDHAPDALRALIYSDWIDMQSGVAGHRVDVRSRPQIRHHRGR